MHIHLDINNNNVQEVQLSTYWEKWQNKILFIIAGNGLQWPKSDSYTRYEYHITTKLLQNVEMRIL